MKKTFVGGAVIVAAILAAPALVAQAQQAPSSELGAKDIIAKLEAAGYTSITDVEKDDGRWEVDAVNSAGQRVEVDVDPISGTVLREEPDDND